MYDFASPASIGRSKAAMTLSGPGAQTATGRTSCPCVVATASWANASGALADIRIIIRPRHVSPHRAAFRWGETDAERRGGGLEHQRVIGKRLMVPFYRVD
jgi:hypothetical protein